MDRRTVAFLKTLAIFLVLALCSIMSILSPALLAIVVLIVLLSMVFWAVYTLFLTEGYDDE